MALLPILEFPDPRLRTKAAPVDAAEVTTPAFQQLLDDMFQTMYDAPGIGLAASQVDVHKRFMVIDVSEAHDAPQVFINPQIASASEDSAVTSPTPASSKVLNSCSTSCNSRAEACLRRGPAQAAPRARLSA